jgi:hypothetical protein
MPSMPSNTSNAGNDQWLNPLRLIVQGRPGQPRKPSIFISRITWPFRSTGMRLVHPAAFGRRRSTVRNDTWKGAGFSGKDSQRTANIHRSDRLLENPPIFLFFPPLNHHRNPWPSAIVRKSATAFEKR